MTPAVGNREEVMRNVVDKARERIAARKRNTAEKVVVEPKAQAVGEMDES